MQMTQNFNVSNGMEFAPTHSNSEPTFLAEAQWRIQRRSLTYFPLALWVDDQSPIKFIWVVGGKDRSHAFDHLLVFCADQNSTRFTVDPMRRFSLVKSSSMEITLNRIQTDRWDFVDEHSRWFIENNEMFVLVEDFDFVVLHDFRGQVLSQNDDIAGSKSQARFGASVWANFNVSTGGDFRSSGPRNSGQS